MQDIDCTLCKSKAQIQHSNFTGYQVDMKFKIYLCDNCNTSFPLPRIDSSKIYDFIYKNGANVPGYNRYWEYFKNIKNKYNPLSFLANSEEAYWGIRESLNEIVLDKKSSKILEIGCGLGYLTYALRSEKYNVQGLDISKEAIENARNIFGDYFICMDLFEFVETKIETFDLVILTEVIEHVERPIEFISAILKILKNKGKIIMTTPNRSLAPYDIIWDTEAPPVHHWWFSEDSMKYIANKLSLDFGFINFERYYKKHPLEYKVNKLRKNVLRTPIINENWHLYSYNIPKKKGRIKLFFKNILSRFKFLKGFYLKFKAFIFPSLVLCGESGQILCVIFEKKNPLISNTIEKNIANIR